MILTRKYIFLSALLYTLYCVSMIAWLNPFSFLAESNLVLNLLYISLILFVISFASLLFLKSIKQPVLYSLLIHVLLLFSPLLSVLLLFSFLDIIELNHFTFYSSFLIITIPIVAIYSLSILFNELKTRINDPGFVQETPTEEVELLQLVNDQGKLLFERSISKIVSFEANDNYVNIFYLNEEDCLSKAMVRFSLKKIDEQVSDISSSFERVHKSYLIHSKYISKIEGKSQSYSIKMNYLDNLIPVSRNFDISVFSK